MKTAPTTNHSTAPKMPWQKRAIGWLRDGLIFLAMVWAVNWWMTKDMISAAGDVQIAPMSLARLDGSGVDNIAPDIKRNTLLYFFAPWCSVCRLSINNLAFIDPTDTQIFVVALDYANTNEVQAFVDEVGLTLPVHLGTEQLKDQFNIVAYPSYFVLDDNFILRDRALGYSTAIGLKLRSM